MEAKAHLRYARISPRKVQIVCDLIRGKSVAQANAILMGTPKAASELLLKLLKSAASNAVMPMSALRMSLRIPVKRSSSLRWTSSR